MLRSGVVLPILGSLRVPSVTSRLSTEMKWEGSLFLQISVDCCIVKYFQMLFLLICLENIAFYRR